MVYQQIISSVTSTIHFENSNDYSDWMTKITKNRIGWRILPTTGWWTLW